MFRTCLTNYFIYLDSLLLDNDYYLIINFYRYYNAANPIIKYIKNVITATVNAYGICVFTWSI